MPRCRVTRRVHFNAAHRLHNPAATEEWNQATYGECNNPNFHGHNYELDLSVEGQIDPRTGYVMDLNHLKQLAQERLLQHLDHKNLNVDVPWMADIIPTTELRREVARRFARYEGKQEARPRKKHMVPPV